MDSKSWCCDYSEGATVRRVVWLPSGSHLLVHVALKEENLVYIYLDSVLLYKALIGLDVSDLDFLRLERKFSLLLAVATGS